MNKIEEISELFQEREGQERLIERLEDRPLTERVKRVEIYIVDNLDFDYKYAFTNESEETLKRFYKFFEDEEQVSRDKIKELETKISKMIK